MENKILILKERLDKLGIKIELTSNFPWVYLDKVNSKKVTELFQSEHGFVIGFMSPKENNKSTLTDVKEIFKIIKKYY